MSSTELTQFADIQHQSRAVGQLTRALRAGRTHHAYLFEGPEGVGKEATARILARTLLCAGRTDAGGGLFGAEPPDPTRACDACASCRMTLESRQPDLHLIDRKLHLQHPDPAIRRTKGLFLGVEIIRHFLIEPAGLKPIMSPLRVFVIRDAQRMNESAQNALLKTLEEPPGATVLILLTSSASRLLSTIRSRCQQVTFNPLPSTFVAERLAALSDLDSQDAQTLAALSEGSVGRGLELVQFDVLPTLLELTRSLAGGDPQQPEPIAKRMLERVDQLAGRVLLHEAAQAADAAQADDPDAPRKRAKKAAPKTIPTDTRRDALKLVLNLLAHVWRDVLVRRATNDNSLLRLPALQQEIERLEAADVVDPDSAIRATASASEQLDRNVAPQLVLERLWIASGAPALPV